LPSRFIQFLFTLTSLAPMCLVYATLFSFDSDPLLSLTTNRWKAIGCLVLMFILVGTCLAVLRFYSKKVKQRSLEIHSLKPVDQPAIGFVVAYLLPVAFETAFAVRIEVLVAVLILLAWLVYVSDSYLVNPLLRLFGYRFYEVMDEDNITYKLVSRSEIVNTDEPVDVRTGSKFMFLKVKG